MFLVPLTVTRVRDGGTDRNGDRKPDLETRIDDCTLAPAGSAEDGDMRASAITGYTLYAPPGSDIRPSDRFRLPTDFSPVTQLWDVDGDIGVWANPYTGDRPGVVANLKRRSG